MARKKEEIVDILRQTVEKMKEVGPAVAEGWGGAVQIIMPDLKTGWLMKFAMDGTIGSWDEKIDEKSADGTLEINSDVFVDIWEKRLGPMEALAEHKLDARGSLDALIKLLPALM